MYIYVYICMYVCIHVYMYGGEMKLAKSQMR